MNQETAIKLFEQKQVRSIWDAEQEKWYFSVVDVISVLSDQIDHQGARNYWKVLKSRLLKEGNETVTNCNRLKLIAEDGKMRLTDVADTEQLFRLIQSVPSPKAEPFKLWIAKVARERIDEIEDPEIGIDRLMETYLKKGYSKEWINQRLKSIEVRKELTDEWDTRGVKKGQEYAILTDEITKAWSGLTVKEYKNHKDLKKENLRDNMTNLELVLNMLAEATTSEISKEKKPKTFDENKIIANQGGTIAGNTRKEIEEKTGKKVVSTRSAKKLLADKAKQIKKK
ncbi:Bro-N domain-containing protein [uncultured Cytophaga sp.]|uniref:BRO-N domain-containing protein n=1 Tax=uncultured Cytophaga sp. TaxID=160238 RepID=UPI00263A0125|nr:Bro-N domain-containing protein [uncultured Cytophaga sp.]